MDVDQKQTTMGSLFQDLRLREIVLRNDNAIPTLSLIGMEKLPETMLSSLPRLEAGP